MKEKIQQLPPAVVIAVAVVALGIAGFFGIRNFVPESSKGSSAGDYASHQTKYTTNGRGTNNQAAGYAQRGGYGGGQQPPGGGYGGGYGGRQPGGYGGGGQQPGGYGGGGQQPGGYGGGGQQPGGYGGR